MESLPKSFVFFIFCIPSLPLRRIRRWTADALNSADHYSRNRKRWNTLCKKRLRRHPAPKPFLCLFKTRLRAFFLLIKLSFDRDMFLSLNSLLILLRDAQSQDTVLGDIIAHIEASLHCPCIALPADIFAFLVLLVFIETLRR